MPHEDPADVDPDLLPSAVSLPQWPVLVVVAVGGVLGTEARYGLGLLVPHDAPQFPWSTLIINASGALLLGALMTVIETLRPHRLVRPLLGTGVLGGYTTFSTFAVDAVRMAHLDRVAVAASYVAATVVICAAAVWCGTALARLPLADRRGALAERRMTS